MGVKSGKYYSANVPLRDGINDDTCARIFVPVMQKVMEMYQPTALVLQCGSDSLSGDRLGSVLGHAECVRHMLTYHLPTLVLVPTPRLEPCRVAPGGRLSQPLL